VREQELRGSYNDCSEQHSSQMKLIKGNANTKHTGWAKKVSHVLLSISLPNIEQFSNFFRRHILWNWKFVIRPCTRLPDKGYKVVYSDYSDF